MFKVAGSDFVDAVIPAGAEIVCDFEVTDSGNIVLEISVPSIGANFKSDRNFYSRREAEIDYTNAAIRVREDAERVQQQLTGNIQEN